MKELKVIISIAIILSVVWIFTQNAAPVELKLMGATYSDIPLYMVILASVILGMLFGFSITIGQNLTLRRGIRIIEKERVKLQTEIDKRRQAVLDEDDPVEASEKG